MKRESYWEIYPIQDLVRVSATADGIKREHIGVPKYGWRFKGANGEILFAGQPSGYATKVLAQRALVRSLNVSANAAIEAKHDIGAGTLVIFYKWSDIKSRVRYAKAKKKG